MRCGRALRMGNCGRPIYLSWCQAVGRAGPRNPNLMRGHERASASGTMGPHGSEAVSPPGRRGGKITATIMLMVVT